MVVMVRNDREDREEASKQRVSERTYRAILLNTLEDARNGRVCGRQTENNANTRYYHFHDWARSDGYDFFRGAGDCVVLRDLFYAEAPWRLNKVPFHHAPQEQQQRRKEAEGLGLHRAPTCNTFHNS